MYKRQPHSDAVRNLSPIGESLAEFRARRHEIKSYRFSPRRVRGEKHLSRSVCRAAILVARHGAQRGDVYKRQVLWIVGITNAVNLIDGLDGLACGVSTISAISMLVIALLVSESDVALVMAALVGARCV